VTKHVVVFSCHEPRVPSLAEYLNDSDVEAVRIAAAEDLWEALLTYPAVLIMNTTLPGDEAIQLVREIRDHNGGALHIMALNDGHHQTNEVPLPADSCLHDLSDLSGLAAVVRALLLEDDPE